MAELCLSESVCFHLSKFLLYSHHPYFKCYSPDPCWIIIWASLQDQSWLSKCNCWLQPWYFLMEPVFLDCGRSFHNRPDTLALFGCFCVEFSPPDWFGFITWILRVICCAVIDLFFRCCSRSGSDFCLWLLRCPPWLEAIKTYFSRFRNKRSVFVAQETLLKWSAGALNCLRSILSGLPSAQDCIPTRWSRACEADLLEKLSAFRLNF